MDEQQSQCTTPCQHENSFPVKLHKILSNVEFCGIISWLPHGRSWRIIKRDEFEQRIIPRYFRHHHLSSFMRQVNGWVFLRISKGPDRNSYYHEKFLRDKRSLCKQLKRPTSDELRLLRSRSNKDSEPDFHKMSTNDPLPEEKNDRTIEAELDLKLFAPYQVTNNLQECYEHEQLPHYDPCSSTLRKRSHYWGSLQSHGSLYAQSPPDTRSQFDFNALTYKVNYDVQQALNMQSLGSMNDLKRQFEQKDTKSDTTALQIHLVHLQINQLEKRCNLLARQLLH